MLIFHTPEHSMLQLFLQKAICQIKYCSASIIILIMLLLLNPDFSQCSIYCRAPRACPCSTLRFTERTVPWTAYSWWSWRTSWGPDSCPRLNSCWMGRWLIRYSQHTLCTPRSNDLCIYALRIMGSHFFQATFTIHVHDRWWSEKVKLEFSTCFIIPRLWNREGDIEMALSVRPSFRPSVRPSVTCVFSVTSQ